MMLIKISEEGKIYYFPITSLMGVLIHTMNHKTGKYDVTIQQHAIKTEYGRYEKQIYPFQLTEEELQEFQESCDR